MNCATVATFLKAFSVLFIMGIPTLNVTVMLSQVTEFKIDYFYIK